MCKGGTTSGLRNHLKVKHKINLTQKDSQGKSDRRNETAKDSEEDKPGLGQVLSEILACDNYSINQLANSSRVRSGLKKEYGIELPIEPSEFFKIVDKHAHEVRDKRKN